MEPPRRRPAQQIPAVHRERRKRRVLREGSRLVASSECAALIEGVLCGGGPVTHGTGCFTGNTDPPERVRGAGFSESPSTRAAASGGFNGAFTCMRCFRVWWMRAGSRMELPAAHCGYECGAGVSRETSTSPSWGGASSRVRSRSGNPAGDRGWRPRLETASEPWYPCG